MPYSASMISNNILGRAFRDQIDVSPMKLQKILYFAASEYGKKTGQTLLGEPFQQWQYGPVVRSVYDEFSGFGAKPITAYAKDANGKAFIVTEDSNLLRVMDAVWGATKHRTAAELSRITHYPNSAWYQAWERNERYITDASVAADQTYSPALGLGV